MKFIILGPILIAIGLFLTIFGFTEEQPNSSQIEISPKIGDIFGFTNPGTPNDPDAKPKPFVAIYTITEIKAGKCRVNIHYLHVDGTTSNGEYWKDGTKFDTKLSK